MSNKLTPEERITKKHSILFNSQFNLGMVIRLMEEHAAQEVAEKDTEISRLKDQLQPLTQQMKFSTRLDTELHNETLRDLNDTINIKNKKLDEKNNLLKEATRLINDLHEEYYITGDELDMRVQAFKQKMGITGKEARKDDKEG